MDNAKNVWKRYDSWCYCSLHTLICVGLSIMSLKCMVKI